MSTALAEVTESDLLDRLMPAIRQAQPKVHEHALQMRNNLESLAGVFSRYPSIFDERSMGEQVHSIETLIELLFRDGCDRTVLLPTKVAVGRAMLVARFNFYGLLMKVCDSHHRYAGFRQDLHRCWEAMGFSLLIEDVYQVIIERAGTYTPALRRTAAVDLLHLWEHRSDRNVPGYAPIIVDLWRVRKRVAPVFGTMLGTMELLRISCLLSESWSHFLAAIGTDAEAIQALEEFIFGLSYEQISRVRNQMRERNMAVIDRDELTRMLGDDVLPEDIEGPDPREMCRFYQRRAQDLIRRTFADLPGPRRTLEEILLVYVLSGRPQ